MTAQELGSQPAFPGTGGDKEDAGLTKLELFTLGAMVGLLTNPDMLDPDGKPYHDLAKMAVKTARVQLDALVKEASP